MTTIYYFSGTGNSLKVAKDIQNKLGDAKLISMAKAIGELGTDISDVIGLVFPVYFWGVPTLVARFMQQLKAAEYVFIVLTYGESPGAAVRQAERILQLRNIKLSAAFGIAMPDGYLPLVNAYLEKKQQTMFQKSSRQIQIIADKVSKREVSSRYPETPVLGAAFSGFINSNFTKRQKAMDKNFWVNEHCEGCGICRRVCPAKNIEVNQGTPQWLHRCEMCMACIQWCPKQAIEYGKQSAKKRRYQHPDVELSEMFLRN